MTAVVDSSIAGLLLLGFMVAKQVPFHATVLLAVPIASVAALNQLDFDSVLRDLRVPIVAINSDFGEPTDTVRIRSVVPAFRVVTLEGTGHFPMLEAPERFNPLLLQQIALLMQGGGGAS